MIKIRESKSGEPYFVTCAENGQVLTTSEMYSSDQALQRGIKSLLENLNSIENPEIIDERK